MKHFLALELSSEEVCSTCLPQCLAPHCPELTSPQRTPDPAAELSSLMLPLPLGELRLCKGDIQGKL